MTNNNTTRSISVSTLLGVIFIVLKSCGVIAWSWWWVLSPFWMPTVIALVLIVIMFLLLR